MTKEEMLEECLSLPSTFADYPFGPSTCVIKNKDNGKMFAFFDYAEAAKIKKSCGEDTPVEDGDLIINLKCEPVLCEILRSRYAAVVPGYYSNKALWNTVVVGKDVPLEELRKMIKHSYELIAPKKK